MFCIYICTCCCHIATCVLQVIARFHSERGISQNLGYVRSPEDPKYTRGMDQGTRLRWIMQFKTFFIPILSYVIYTMSLKFCYRNSTIYLIFNPAQVVVCFRPR